MAETEYNSVPDSLSRISGSSDSGDDSTVAGSGSQGLAAGFRALGQGFGCGLLVLLFSIQHLIKGFASSLTGKANPYMFKSYHVPAQEMQILKTVVFSPYVLKPMLGLASDLLPIGGYSKGPYMFLTVVLGFAACVTLGFSEMPLVAFVLCLFLLELMVCDTDLLTEAVFAAKMQENPELGQSLLTFVYAGLSLFSLVATLASGFVLKFFGPRGAYELAAVSVLPALVAISRNLLKEHRKSKEQIAAIRENFWKQKEACALALVILCSSVAMSVSAILSASPFVNAAVCLASALGVVTCYSLVLSPVIAKFSCFTLLQTALHPSVSGPAFYFMTDTIEEYPDGPHFSEVFYNTVIGSVSGVASLVGLYTYNRYSSRFSYRMLLVASNLAFSLLHLSDVVLFTRANKRIGLPDYVFAFGNQSLGTAIYQWLWMPQVALFAQLCPKEMEATMFALIVACHNLGVNVASSAGALMLELLDCNPKGSPGDSSQFENLWIASAISSVLPMVSVLALFWLVPDLHAGKKPPVGLVPDSATTGSLWKRLTAQRTSKTDDESAEE